jgi:acetyltransferase-like isoleucine patch superfamily enzyme
MHRQGRRNSRHLSRTRQYHAATVDLRSSRLPPVDWELLMSIADRLIRRLFARSLEPMVREAVAEQLASVVKDPLREPLIYGDATRLHIDPTAVVNNALFNLSSGDITVGRHAFFGHNVAILTGTHDFTTFGRERQIAVPKTGRDVSIGEGAWLASFAIVVGPCSIGEHAVVGVGSLVLDNVDPYTVVAGSPASVRRTVHTQATTKPAHDP